MRPRGGRFRPSIESVERVTNQRPGELRVSSPMSRRNNRGQPPGNIERDKPTPIVRPRPANNDTVSGARPSSAGPTESIPRTGDAPPREPRRRVRSSPGEQSVLDLLGPPSQYPDLLPLVPLPAGSIPLDLGIRTRRQLQRHIRGLIGLGELPGTVTGLFAIDATIASAPLGFGMWKSRGMRYRIATWTPARLELEIETRAATWQVTAFRSIARPRE